MGNAIKSVTQKLTKFDPITHALSPGGKYDAFNTKPGAPAPPYDPSKDPGRALQIEPAGGNPNAIPGGQVGMFGGTSQRPLFAPSPGSGGGPLSVPTNSALQPGSGGNGYVPNFWQTPSPQIPPATVNVNQGMPPNGPGTNPALQRQVMMAQGLRNLK